MQYEGNKWRLAILPRSTTLVEAIRNLDSIALKIILVVDDDNNNFIGTLTDGDIRRGLLKGCKLEDQIYSLVNLSPIIVGRGISKDEIIELMQEKKVQQIPVIDENSKIIGLHLWDNLMAHPKLDNWMIIMAGGLGTRLRPHTESCPKPLLQVSGKPILEHIIERAKLEGFSKFIISIGYLGHMIEEYFGNGQSLNISIEYIEEKFPLGTAGALSLIEQQPLYPIVVVNGDVLTDIQYSKMLDFHIQNCASGTMAVSKYEWQNPYGVVRINGVEITAIDEKPITREYINAGVYILDKNTLSFLQKNDYCDMPELFEILRQKSMRTIAYPIHETWIDIGSPSDYQKAQKLER